MYFFENKTQDVHNQEKFRILKTLENLVVSNYLFSSIMNVSNYDIVEIYKMIALLSNLDYIRCRTSCIV
jgi:hypothetical protein